jgi:hypothetical protein
MTTPYGGRPGGPRQLNPGTPTSAAQNQSAQNQTAQSGSAQNQTAQNQTAQNQTAQNQSAQSGSAQNQTAQSGSAQNQSGPASTQNAGAQNVRRRVPQAETVQCPMCLESFVWQQAPLYERDGDLRRFKPFDPSSIGNDRRRADRLRSAFRMCPASLPDKPHYLPDRYGLYAAPLVVGLVGTAEAGKSSLLVAMLREISQGHLQPYGFTATPLDDQRHWQFVDEVQGRLFRDGKALAMTRPAREFVEYADALLLSRDGLTRPVAFFDVGGESLQEHGAATQFLVAVDALIFVVDPDRALPRGPDAGAGDPDPDRSFEVVLDRLQARTGDDRHRLDVPAVVAVTKSDTLRFEPPLDRWMRREHAVGEPLDPDLVHAESQDVYAFLYQHHAQPWLRPFNDCMRCTLHFTSATGGNQRDAGYPRGLRPRRVLQPLLSLLTMSGLIDSPGADRVGC